MRRGVNIRGRRGGALAGFNPRAAFGADLILWLRDNLGVTLSTVGEWKDQSGNGYDFSQATQASRPTASGGAAVGGLLSATTRSYATGAWEVWHDHELSATTTAKGIWQFDRDGGTNAAGLISWSSYNICNTTAAANSAHASYGTVATGRQLHRVSFDGVDVSVPGSYTAAIDGVVQAVAAGLGGLGSAGLGTMLNKQGARSGLATTYEYVVYNKVLSVAERAILTEWFANHTPGYEPTTISNLRIWLRPSVGQSGDVSAWADQGPAGNNVAQATLANQPYFDLDDSVGDLRPSLIGDGTADFMATAGDVAAFAGAAALTGSAWVRVTSATHALMAQWQAPNKCFAFYNIGGGYLRLYVSQDGTEFGHYVTSDAVVLPASTWVHVAFTFSSGTVVLYANGVAVASTVTGGAFASALVDANAVVSVLGDVGTYATGRMDDIVLAKRAATPTQVAKLATYYTRSG